MRTSMAIALTLALGTALALTPPPLAHAARSPIARPIAAATKDAKRTFQAEARTAYATLRTATTSFSGGLRGGDEAVANSVRGYAQALAAYLTTIRVSSEGVAADVATDVADILAEFEGTEEKDGLAGGGGALDKFGDQMQLELDRAHKRVVSHTRRFMAAVERATGRDARPTFRINRLTFGPLPAPVESGALATGHRPLALDMYVAVRLQTVGVVIVVAGSAAPEQDGGFDVRLVNPAHVAVGEFLSDGGVSVASNGSWVATDTLGTPGGGQAFASGNRTIQFGVEPFDGGLAGTQPGRLVRAGVIGIR